jgi:hypothetical protein
MQVTSARLAWIESSLRPLLAGEPWGCGSRGLREDARCEASVRGTRRGEATRAALPRAARHTATRRSPNASAHSTIPASSARAHNRKVRALSEPARILPLPRRPHNPTGLRPMDP